MVRWEQDFVFESFYENSWHDQAYGKFVSNDKIEEVFMDNNDDDDSALTLLKNCA